VAKNSTIASPSSDYKITYTGNNDLGNLDPTTDTGTEYTFNTDYTYSTDSMANDDGTISLDMTGQTGFADMSFGFDYDDNWPSESTIQEMIKDYPALRIQYEKFVEIYNLVKDDYRSGQKKNV